MMIIIIVVIMMIMIVALAFIIIAIMVMMVRDDNHLERRRTKAVHHGWQRKRNKEATLQLHITATAVTARELARATPPRLTRSRTRSATR